MSGKGTLPQKVTVSYCLADFTLMMLMMIAASFYAYFLTDIAGISAAAMGVILFTARIGDAVSVPVAGAIIQKTQLKWGQFRSWILIAPPLTALFFTLMFANYNADVVTKSVLFTVFYLLGHVCVNFATNGHLALMSVLGRSAVDRMKLSTRRAQFQTAANIVFSLSFMPLVGILGGGDLARGFLLSVIIFALLQVAGFWNIFRLSGDYEQYNPNLLLRGENTLSLADMGRQITGNTPLLLVMAADTARFLGMFVILGMAAFYFDTVVGELQLITVYLLASAVASFLGSLISPVVCARFGKKTTYLLATLLPAVIFVAARFMVGTDVFLYIAFTSFAGFFGIFSTSIGPALYVDSAEYGFHKTGKDGRAIIMGMFAMPIKIGVALSAAVIGFGLSAIGYDQMTVVTPDIAGAFLSLALLVPAACYLCSFIFISIYKLTDEEVATYAIVNAQKRAAEVL